jgi:glycosyltransferase involved in cell wall biosynthesis
MVQKQAKMAKHPYVSICTPTYNRRKFIPAIIKCFLAQDYPKDQLEWIVVDDGTDKVGDLFSPFLKEKSKIRYFSLDEKMPLGKKRNFMHSKCSGEVIVYMDDDDYYPPTRVSHAVATLRANPRALCAGSSEMHVYFTALKEMYTFGPYGPNHATAGTFAFRRSLLDITRYDDAAEKAEEKQFLNGYTIPLVQLDPLKTILVFSHDSNTFDRTQLINGNRMVRKSTYTLDDFIIG